MDMEIGILVTLSEDVDAVFKKVADNGFSSCQLCNWNISLYRDDIAKEVLRCTKQYGVSISALWSGWSGPGEWNFTKGPYTLGLVPPKYRKMRVEELCKASDFAKQIHVTDVITHVGFLPENPECVAYSALVKAIRQVAEYCKKNGQYFLFETGQETPITLKRTIERVGTGNLGINLDPANLLMYGKANPVDALDIFGQYVRNIHGKDGEYPTDPLKLGVEKPIGEGRVHYELLIPKLKEIGYQGPITIEREISGEQQIKDIRRAKAMLEALIAQS